MITAAASKYVPTVPSWPTNVSGNTPGASAATRLYPNETPTPSPISVNMLRLRCASDATNR